VPIITSAEVVAAYGDGALEGIDVMDKHSRDVRRLEAQAVVAALGFTADIGPLQAWGLNIADRPGPEAGRLTAWRRPPTMDVI